jgi:arylsulfatase A
MTQRPNIVIILADDMGYGDLSCLNEASGIDTPHMDRLVAEGMAFTDAHASSSVCTPSRYGILTGRYAWRGRLQRWVLGPLEQPLIEDDVRTLPAFLREHSYHTACIGKWHLGMEWPFRHPRSTADLDWRSDEIVEAANDIDYDQAISNGPTTRGFDHYFGVDVPNFPPYCFIEDDRTVGCPDRPKPDTLFGTPGPMVEELGLGGDPARTHASRRRTISKNALPALHPSSSTFR